MSIFYSPLNNPSSWSYSMESMTIPAGFRYGGYRPRVLRATIGAGDNIIAPGNAILKKYSGPEGHFLELQFSPFLHRELAHLLPGGLPTFYFSFPNNTGFDLLEDDSLREADSVLRTSDSVGIAMMSQDCLIREPVYWAQLIRDAMSSIGEDTATWEPFLTKISSDFSGNDSPVLILTGQGSLAENAALDIVYTTASGEIVYNTLMIPADHGDLQQTVARMSGGAGIPIGDLWSRASSLVLRPSVPALQQPAFQFSRAEDGLEGVGEISVEPTLRHILLTHIHDWIAPQINPEGLLPRFSRGNKLTPFVNGPEFFDELFRQLHTANSSGNGFHHVGYLVKYKPDLTEKKDDDPPELSDLALNLKDVLTRISDDDGKACVLPALFYQLDPEAPIDEAGVILLFIHFLLLLGLLVLYDNDVELFSVKFARIDQAGLVVIVSLLLIGFFIPTVLSELLGEDGILFDDDGNLIFDKNVDVAEFIEGLDHGRAILAAYPAEVSDNPNAATDDLVDIGLNFVERFGIYHQKFSVLKNPGGYMAYCGGIDLNENRLDDQYHLADNPYHDTHTKVEGPAVRDIAQNFQHRWQHEAGSTTDLAFSLPDITALGTPGKQIVQVANTYFQTSDSTRALSFAPTGDRTILNTLLLAIQQAQEYIYIEDQYFTPPLEYRTALLNKVTSRTIKKLIIMVPDEADQPFGDIEKLGFINELIAADMAGGGGIVHIGFPRGNYRVSNNDVRASSGKMLLMEDMPKDASTPTGDELITLGTGARLSDPPFYLNVNGEVMYAYRVENTVTSESEESSESEEATTLRESTRKFYVKRGDDLPDMGTKRIAHKQGAAVTVLNYPSIYVHSKTMIVDDIFLSIGSANVNRRGFFHDGETQVFSMPQQMRAAVENPIRDLRLKLWADMLNLPREMAAPLLRDPIAAAKLFERSPQQGNRFINLKDRQAVYLLGFTPAITTTKGLDLFINSVMLAFTLPNLTYDKFYRTIVDPTTNLEFTSP